MSTLQRSLDSILNQMTDRYEIIVVDAESTDGSLGLLRMYQSEGKIRLIVKKSSRGTGRQLAFEHSSGEFIIANVDLDEVYPSDTLEKLAALEPYAKDKIIMVNDRLVRSGSHGFTLSARHIISSLGGWRDLNYYEDYELWRRAAFQGKYAWTVAPINIWKYSHPERRTFLGRLKHRYTGYANKLQVGIPVFGKGEKKTAGQTVVYSLAKSISLFKRSYRDSASLHFDPLCKEYFLDTKDMPDSHEDERTQMRGHGNASALSD
jgi:glycosyltransferase involved in cell wall biosynthesis